jgi:hypothetical protein
MYDRNKKVVQKHHIENTEVAQKLRPPKSVEIQTLRKSQLNIHMIRTYTYIWAMESSGNPIYNTLKYDRPQHEHRVACVNT